MAGPSWLTMTGMAPSAAQAREMAAPMPTPPPVTRITFSFSPVSIAGSLRRSFPLSFILASLEEETE
jgi:hypothetical protein